jgi:hypothetical protein
LMSAVEMIPQVVIVRSRAYRGSYGR